MATAKAPVDHSAISGPKDSSDTLDTLAAVLDQKPQTNVPSAFDAVVVGKKFTPPKILCYGMDGIGKSTFASQAPNPITIQTEDGNEQIGTPRFPKSTSLVDFMGRLNSVATLQHGYSTVIIDGLSGLERLIYETVAKESNKRNIDEVGGGFDKGQKLAVTQWTDVIHLLDLCWAKGMAIIVLGHARSEKIGDPENPMAEQYGLALHKKTSGEMFRRWADATLFFTRRMTTRTEGQGIMAKTVAVPIGPDGGERIIKTTWTPAAVAKNRYDMPPEIAMPKNGSWDLVMSYIAAYYEQKKG